MGLFSRSGRKPSVQRVTPVELALSLTAIAGGSFDAHRKAAQRLGYPVVPLELFVFSAFATAWNASRHPLLTALTKAQRQVVADTYSVFSYCLWSHGREALAKRLPDQLDWAHYVVFKNTVDFRQYPPFATLVRERAGEYEPLVNITGTDADPAKIALRLGDAVARHLLGPNTPVGPVQALWCAQLFQEISPTVSASLSHYKYQRDPEAEASAIVPDASVDTMILSCPRCGQKNRVPAGRRAEAICGRCRAPL
ncbi:MAG TPA: hypothetical protein VKZ50_10885 [bacterium]|nr:hypothetical protein [bacterium]